MGFNVNATCDFLFIWGTFSFQISKLLPPFLSVPFIWENFWIAKRRDFWVPPSPIQTNCWTFSFLSAACRMTMVYLCIWVHVSWCQRSCLPLPTHNSDSVWIVWSQLGQCSDCPNAASGWYSPWNSSHRNEEFPECKTVRVSGARLIFQTKFKCDMSSNSWRCLQCVVVFPANEPASWKQKTITNGAAANIICATWVKMPAFCTQTGPVDCFLTFQIFRGLSASVNHDETWTLQINVPVFIVNALDDPLVPEDLLDSPKAFAGTIWTRNRTFPLETSSAPLPLEYFDAVFCSWTFSVLQSVHVWFSGS